MPAMAATAGARSQANFPFRASPARNRLPIASARTPISATIASEPAQALTRTTTLAWPNARLATTMPGWPRCIQALLMATSNQSSPKVVKNKA